jgi:hypothetical protein
MYAKWFILIFASILAGIGFINLINIRLFYKNSIYVLIFFLIISVSFSGYFQILHERKSDIASISDSEYMTSIWIKQYSNAFISNSRIDGWKIAAISNNHFLTGSSTADQAYGFIDVRDYNLTKRPISSEEYWLDSPYVITQSDYYWQMIMERDIKESLNKRLIKKFNITMFMQSTKLGNSWLSSHGYRSSPFVSSISNNQNRIYDSGNLYIWDIKDNIK